ncbi:MAG: enoyl-CoA hydratase/isomerase family protein, partial [Anaerolineaceae bacterium]|nr:enoyl-CoA hydratase/isomerase family protein [Anaerolineaceae bacterium]
MAFIQYEEHDQVGLLTIDRPQALNALNTELLKELEQVLDQVDLENTRCLVVTGAGEKAFIAGADVAEMCEMNAEEGREFGAYGNRIFRKLEVLPIPVIAAING